MPTIAPQLAEVAQLVADPGRANILSILMDGRALTADVALLDPFVTLHSVPESSNDAIDDVATALAQVANSTKAAIGIVAHSRKQAPGSSTELTADDNRGASALETEHTLTAYRRALADGADVLELDVQETRSALRMGDLLLTVEREFGAENVRPTGLPADRRRSKAEKSRAYRTECSHRQLALHGIE